MVVSWMLKVIVQRVSLVHVHVLCVGVCVRERDKEDRKLSFICRLQSLGERNK